jgi:hypothetical protein
VHSFGVKSAYVIRTIHTNESSSYQQGWPGSGAPGQWSVRQQENEALAVPLGLLEIKRIGIFNEIDKQLLFLSHAAAALIDAQAYPVVTKSDAAPLGVREFAVPSQNGRRLAHEPRSGRELRLVIVMGALLVALGLGWFGGSNLYRYFDRRDELTGRAAINAVVERIIGVESNGEPNTKNSRSSAKGLGQFLNETWLDLIRTYRPDLIRGRSENETLELRREAKLAREITTRFVERNAGMLRQRGLPVTAGTVYLAHFAGGAGAVAILSAPENADAALVMASADATGRTKREQIIKANPFLEHFTVADLKIWADRKMRGPGLHLTEVFAADAKK